MTTLDRYKVLVVEADEQQGQWLRSLLEDKAELCLARTGQEALAQLLQPAWHVVLVGTPGPDLPAAEVLRRAQAEQPQASCLLLGAEGDPPDAGPLALARPLAGPELVRAVALAAERSHLLRENQRLAAALQAAQAAAAHAADERRQAEDALRTAQMKYKILIETIPQGLAFTDETGQIVETNAEAERLLGVSRAEHQQRRLDDAAWQLLRPDGTPLPPEASPGMRALKERQRQTDVELGVVRGDGQVAWLRVTAAPMALPGYGVVLLYGDSGARRQAEAALRDSEARFRVAFDQSPIGTALVSATDFHFIRVNAAFCRMFGYSPDELHELKFADITHPQHRESSRTNVFRLLAGEIDQYVADRRYLRKDGTELWGHLSLRLVRDAAGTPLYTMPLIEDITDRVRGEQERQQAEAALRESEELFRTFIEHASDAVVITDEAGRIIEWNRASERSTRLARAEMLGMPFWEMQMRLNPPERQTPERRAYLRETLQAALATGRAPIFDRLLEARLRQPDGQWHYIQQVSFPIPTPRGYRLGTMTRDITERHQMEDALRASEAQLRAYLDYSPAAIFVADAAGRYIDVNPAACGLTGYTRAELLERSMTDLVPAEELPAFQKRLAGNAGNFFGETPLRRKDGSVITVIRTRVRLPGGELLSFCLDITARREAEAEVRRLNVELEQRVEARTAELKRALKVKDEFLSIMSHELRTPLTAIMGLSESLRMGIYGPLSDRQANAVGTVYTSGEHLLELITDMLDYVRIDAGQLLPETGPVEVTEVCAASLHTVLPAAQHKQQHLTHKADLNVRLVWGNSRHLMKMLLHLLSNAVKFTPEGGTVSLTVEGDAARGEVRFTVADTGIGIPPAQQARLFEPFQQLDSGLARKYEGTGLGLALVRRLAELYGGRIAVASDGVPGHGAQFTLHLPWKPAG